MSPERNRELLLLSASAAFILVAWRALDAAAFALPATSHRIVAQFLLSALAGHAGLRLFAPRAAAQPYAVAVLLTAIGLAFVVRLAPAAAAAQANWITLGVILMVATAWAARDYPRLRSYKYTSALVAVLLLVATGFLGTTINGARLWITVGGQTVQTTELIKLFLVVFLAGYLADEASVLASPRLRFGGRSYSAHVRRSSSPDLPTATVPMNHFLTDAGGTLAILTRAVDFAAIAAVIGSGAFRFVVVRGQVNNDAADAVSAASDVARFGAAASLLLIAAVCGRVFAQAQAFLEPGEPLFPIIHLIAGTSWGRAASWQLAGAVVAVAGFGVAAGRWKTSWLSGAGWCAAVAASVCAAFTLPFMGHANALEEWRLTGIAADGLHVLAGGAWAGALGALTWCVSRAVRPGSDEAVATLIERFRPLALSSAAVLVISGAVSALLHIGSISELVSSTYGRLLLVKIAMVAAVATLGRKHSMTAARDVRAGRRGSVARSIGNEALLMIAVFLMTALLAGSPPPGE